MVSNHGDVPPAFRGRRGAAAYIGLDDAAVLKAATAAFHAAQEFPVGSKARDDLWARFDDAMSELAARGLRHVLRKLRERGELGGGDGTAGDGRGQ